MNSCDCSPAPFVPVNVTTQHNDNARTGQNLHETTLTPASVRSGNFGWLFSRHLDGQPYAQPLYVHDVDFGSGKKHNVLFAATEGNNVYAFDADRPRQGIPYWQTNLGPTYHIDQCQNLQPTIGITSTPAIDVDSNTMYVLAVTDGGAPACPYVKHRVAHQLHALDLTTGLDKLPPATICGTVPGYSDDGIYNIRFDSKFQHNRPGLLLDHGVVYAAFGSHCDNGPYWGWVFAFDAKTLTPASVPFVVTPRGSSAGGTDGGGGSIWQAGGGLAADEDGFVYAMTGNGHVDTAHTPPSLSESFLKLRIVDGVFSVAGYYLDHRHALLSERDKDLGSSGPLLITAGGQHFVTGGGKEGRLYLLNRDTMGYVQGFQAAGTDVTSDLVEWGEHHFHGPPIYWEGPSGILVYACPEEEDLRAYRFDPNSHYDTHAIWSKVHCAIDMPGGFVSVSANGKSGGIVWVTHPYDSGVNDNGDGAPAALTAVDAVTLATLWDSHETGNELGTLAKFNTPTIADGQVFAPSFDAYVDGNPQPGGSIVVYGLKCNPACADGQECVHGKCQSCSPSEIRQTCGQLCGISDGCGGTCECGPGRFCDREPTSIASPRRGESAINFRPPPRGGGICVCTPATIKRNCDGKCNTSDGCGGVCTCADNQACNPQTQTCCDWQAECQAAGACKRVCGDSVACPCTNGRCDANDRCCAPKCDNAACGAPDGCGNFCFGHCPGKLICVDDGERRSCQLPSGPCRLNPKFCDANPDELIKQCNANPPACFVKLGGMHMYMHKKRKP